MMIAIFRTTLFQIVFYATSVILVPVVALMALVSRDGVLLGAHLWAMWHRLCARVLLGIRVRIEGDIPRGSYLFTLKHESGFEAVETLALFHRPAVIFKKELMRIPVWGWAARRHGVIPIDRDSGGAAVRQMLTAGKAAIADNRPIILFPEGSRMPHGQSPPLGAGMAGLYRLLGLPIIPIACDSGKLIKRGVYAKRSGVITFRVGETIPPGLSREEVEVRVHAAINALNQ
jgi:1-acyl-sn-glycerol-3-phosphate acyltransferase